MKKSHAKSVFLWFVAVCWTLLTLFLSAQPGGDTAETSGGIAKFFHWCLSLVGISVDYEFVHSALRTFAHVGVFFIMGLLIEAAALSVFHHTDEKKKSQWVLIGCVCLAILFETIKIWIPGRHLDLGEIGLNILGVFLGVVIIGKRSVFTSK